jgi:hypothetical protein
MNKAYRQVEKMILKQLENEDLPKIPANRHQRRLMAKVGKK